MIALPFMSLRHPYALTLCLAGLNLLSAAHGQLALRLESAGRSETRLASNVVLHVPAAGTPSPFLSPGPFTADWSGWLNVDLRGDFQFQADHAGLFTLEINGTNVLQTPHASGATDWSRPIRLRKGTNLLRATLSRTNNAEATVRLSWRGRGAPPAPIPTSALTPGDDSGGVIGPDRSAVQRGRDLFLVHRCGRCHDPETPTPVPELTADSPSFADIGSRRRQEWLARWITDPQALQPEATMPRLLHGPSADADAADIAFWLGSLNDHGNPPISTTPPTTAPVHVPVPAIGHALFEALLCQSCHTLEADPDAPGKVSLRFVPEKFGSPEQLVAYLTAPERHYAWTRMPNFQLSGDDAAHIASLLMPADKARPVRHIERDPERIQRGKAMARDRGCFRCHDDPNAQPPGPVHPTVAPAMNDLERGEASTGCLALDNPPPNASGQYPARYRFSAQERSDLQSFLASGRASLSRHVPTDFAERWSRELRCAECHDKGEGVPRLGGIGGKLRPEWFAQFVGGHVSYKPRPWLPGRMPAFPAFAAALAEGYAALDGLPPHSPAEPPPDPDAAAIGRKLVSASAGFACVTCHAIGPFSASAVFEAPGVNLAHSAERLRPDYFIRWVRNPQTFDPTTKMPLYFDEEGNSALADYFDGDGPKTLRALWEYMRPGAGVTPPEP